MDAIRMRRLPAAVVITIIVLLAHGGPRASAQAVDPYDSDEAEVLTRGPIHEAFAEPTEYDPEHGVIITKQPPDVIEEIPPDERLEGAIWIPGYWLWDEEFDDFIWVSGIWRVPPPGSSWVPGYYTAYGSGWVWTSGFWMASETRELEYLPPPPRSLEVGPSSRAPSSGHLWTPGNWIWVDSHYAWRPGYWVEVRPDWVWTPSHYVWTSRGCIYVDGYWDRPFVRRGVIFAPVRFSHVVYTRPRYVYSPSIVIQFDFLSIGLFISPHRHYCFGDYYDVRYTQRGYRPWFHRDRRHRHYDHHYEHERWRRHREDSRWESRLREEYKYRADHPGARPPRTYKEQLDYVGRNATDRQRLALKAAVPIAEAAERRDSPVRFQKIDREERNTLGNRGRELVKYRDERARWEARAEPVGRDDRPQSVPIDSDARRRSIGERPGGPDQERQPAREAVRSPGGQDQPSRERAQPPGRGPEQPGREQVRPSREPVQPAREPGATSGERVQPSREPGQPQREPVQPSRRVEQPPTERVQPSREPGQPQREPVQPSRRAEQPPTERVQPSREPGQPSREPVQPSRRAEQPPTERVQPQREPAQPSRERVEPQREPARPSREPVQAETRRAPSVEQRAPSAPQPPKQRIERSPIYGQPAGPEGSEGSPPRRPDPPKPDLNKRSGDVRQESSRIERRSQPAPPEKKDEKENARGRR